MGLKGNGKFRKGFTLVEVLVVVAILAITLALGVPAVIGAVKRADLKKLDGSAQSIFLAAQNSLTAMSGNGELDDFTLDADGNELAGKLSEKLSAFPSDFPETLKIDEPDAVDNHYLADIRFLDSMTDAHKEFLKRILPGGSIDKELEEGRYIVEYNRANGAVYGVWYSDEQAFKDIGLGGFKHEPREFDKRLDLDFGLGYYGGAGVDYAKVGQMPIPELTVINAEELVLNVKMPDGDFGTGKIAVDVVMEGLTSHAIATILDGAYLDPNTSGEVVLDTLVPAYGQGTSGWSWSGNPVSATFKGWAGSAGFIPGENIKLTITTRYNGTDKTYLSQSATITTNSLFASVSGDTANIAYGRHLQNLNEATSGVGYLIKNAVQIQEIDFEKDPAAGEEPAYSWKATYGTKTFTSLLNSHLTSYNGNSLPIRNMNAVQNDDGCAGLFSDVENATLSNIVLIDATVQASGGVAANVGALAGAAGDNVTVENCQVYLEKKGNTNPPATMLEASGALPSDSVHVGGLIGLVNDDHVSITNSFAATVLSGKDPTGVDKGCVGGLVGEVLDGANLNVNNSYAACYLAGGKNVGGLIGRKGSGTVTISNSYAAGVINNATITAGGLVAGVTDSLTVNNAYSAVRYSDTLAENSRKTGTPTVTVYGAAPGMGATPDHVYFVRQMGVKYADDSGTGVSSKKLSEMKKPDPAAPADSLDGDWYNLPAETKDPITVEIKANPTYATFPYHQTDETKNLTTPYPYPMLKSGSMPMLHYGDWLEQDSYATAFYWEQENSAYHFYFVLSDGVEKYVGSDLCTDHHLGTDAGQAIGAWGYGLIGIDETALPTDLATHKETDTSVNTDVKNALKSVFASTPSDFEWESGDEPDADMLKDITDLLSEDSNVILLEGAKIIDSDDAHPTTTSAFYAIETDAGWLEIDLAFAAAIDVSENDGTGTGPAEATSMGKTTDNPYQIRHVQQLDNIPSGTVGSTPGDSITGLNPYEACFEQTHDLNGSGYGKNTYTNSNYFGGTYNGGHYRILELSMKAIDSGSTDTFKMKRTGLFGVLTGENVRLENIILYSPSGNAYIGDDNQANLSAGGLARAVQQEERGGKTTVTISNCVVAGYKIEVNDMSVGGLVGVVVNGAELTVENSAAVNTLTTTKAKEGSGGLVGGVRVNSTVNIKNSYAGGTITVKHNTSETPTPPFGAGGIVGYVKPDGSKPLGTVQYTNVYSYVDLSGVENMTDVTNVYGIGSKGSTTGTGYSGCTYWTGGLGANTALDTDVTGVGLDGLPKTPEAEHTYKPDTTTPKNGYIDLNTATPDDPYPYQAVVKVPKKLYDASASDTDMVPVHYGEWPKGSEFVAAFYWEREETDYNVYLVLSNGTETYTANGLCTDRHLDINQGQDVDDWGYGLIGITATGLDVDNDTTQNPIIESLKGLLADNDEWIAGTEDARESVKKLLDVADNVTLIAKSTTDEVKTISTTANDLNINLAYAAAIEWKDAAAVTMGVSIKNPYQIRTVQQLNHIPANSDKCFRQTHDLNGHADEAGAVPHAGPTGFSGTYQGGSYRILELNMIGGLFTSIGTNATANLSDIILYSPSRSATVTLSGNNAGGLASEVDKNGATITNCVVAGYTMNGVPASGSVGGLIGIVESGRTITIEFCAAANTLSGGNYVGGFIGWNFGIVNIRNSYAGGNITSDQYAGGIVGDSINDSYTTDAKLNFTDIYSYANVKGTYAGCIANVGSGYYFTRCYYWDDGVTANSTLGGSFGGKDSRGIGVSLSDLKAKTGDPTAKYTYKPKTGDPLGLQNLNLATPKNPYPFKAVVQTVTGYDGDGNATRGPDYVHYGDWPETMASSLCYYEKYDGGTLGLWGYIAKDPTSEATLVNTLAKGDPGKGPYATADGYCVPVKQDDTVPDVIMIDNKEVKLDTTNIIGTVGLTDGDLTGTYNLYAVKPDNANMGIEGAYYTSVKLGQNQTQYWFNPAFACEIIQAAGTYAATAPTVPQAKPNTSKLFSSATDDYSDVIIRTARQLANMATATGDDYSGASADKRKAQQRNYVQLLDIDYDKYTGTDLKVGRSDLPRQNPAALFTDDGGVGGSYNGNTFLIRNLYIGGGTRGTGLFGYTKGNLSNIRLVNVSVTSANDDVGALAGNLQGTKIKLDNCGVYVDTAERANAYEEFAISVNSKNHIGGLIGKLSASGSDVSIEISNCFAAVKVEGKNGVGGLIGDLSVKSVKKATFTNCYSGGHTDGGKYDSKNANVSGTKQVGGLIGNIEAENTAGINCDLTLSGVNYSTCSVSSSDNRDIPSLFVGAIDDTKFVTIHTDSATSTAYAVGKAFKKDEDATPRDEKDYLAETAPTETHTDFLTHPYDGTLYNADGTPKMYPYKSGLEEHYGDWEQKAQVTGYIYWELEGSEYNYSVKAWKKEVGSTTWDELAIDPTLCTEYDTHNISNYGYGWFYAGDFDGSTPTMTDATASPDNDAANALKSSLNTALETALPGVDLGTVTVTAYSYGSATPAGTTQTWTIQQGSETLQTATLNPDFADTINRDATTPYKVRTIRQLQNINHTAYLAQSFTQGHDLDGDGFTYTPIGNGTGDFTGRYDGKGYRIRNLDISVTGEDACAGLFGKASGSANFERIIMWGNDNTISASDSSGTLIKNSRARVGGIVAEIPSGSVTISNCVVTGYRLEVSATGAGGAYTNNVYVGGIVANLNGTVTNCEAVVEIRNNNGTAYIGGLVGEIGEDSTGGVANSYAGGTITTSDTHCVGGVVGESNGKSIVNCYSYVTGNVSYAINAHRKPNLLGIGSKETNESRPTCAYLGSTFANDRNNGAAYYADFTAMVAANWFDGKSDSFGTPTQIDGKNIDPTSTNFIGAVVKVPIDSEGNEAYVHYGDLPTGANVTYASGDPGFDGPEIMTAALPPEPPEVVPDPTPSEPDPGSAGKEEDPE